ncbi:MAG TPA: hypothetical protein VIG36_13850, partial [Methylocystis sp.]
KLRLYFNNIDVRIFVPTGAPATQLLILNGCAGDRFVTKKRLQTQAVLDVLSLCVLPLLRSLIFAPIARCLPSLIKSLGHTKACES